MRSTVHILGTGVGNIASLRAAFARLDVDTKIVSRPAEIGDAAFVVLPGVGAFAAAMQGLRWRDWQAALKTRIADGAPTLAICLGMQLLGAGSQESLDCEGLTCVPQRAEPFLPPQRVPHMGWNRVDAGNDCELLRSGDAYFAHSYFWADRPDGFAAAATEHGVSFVAAVERGAVLACQFHPELSGGYGADLLSRWLQRGGAAC